MTPCTNKYNCPHLEETQVVQKLANIVDDTSAFDEDIPTLCIQHEIEVTLAVSLFLILETKVLLGQLVQVGRQEDHGLGRDRQLSLFSAQRRSRHSHNITPLENGMQGFKFFG